MATGPEFLIRGGLKRAREEVPCFNLEFGWNSVGVETNASINTVTNKAKDKHGPGRDEPGFNWSDW